MVFNVSKGPYPRPRDPKPKFNVEALPLRGLVAVSKFSKLRPFSREGQGAPAVVGGQTNRETVRAVRAWAAEGLPRHSRHDFWLLALYAALGPGRFDMGYRVLSWARL